MIGCTYCCGRNVTIITITQYVSINDRAWHAGQSDYCGRERCNDFSVGIELEGSGVVRIEELRVSEP